MARGGDARIRRRAPQTLRRPRGGRRTPRPAPGRSLEGATAQATQGNPRGAFITIEGLDFSGKSTLVRYLKELLAGSGPPTYFTREPGGTPAAERIRRILLDPDVDMDAWSEAYLYAAARADHARREILPRLGRGETVVCERYLDSSIAYQGFGRGLGAGAVRDLNSWAVENVLPDRTFYLRLDVEERERRARGGRASLDRIESVGAAFMVRVERGFEEIVRLEPQRMVVLDAVLPASALAELVVRGIHSLR